MDLIEATRCCAAAFPEKQVTIEQSIPGRGAYSVVVDGELKGRNFDLMKACQEACMPVLEKARAESIAAGKAKVEDFKLFGLFLMELFASDFAKWKAAKAQAEYPPREPTFKDEVADGA